jgi:hypothetical protein
VKVFAALALMAAAPVSALKAQELPRSLPSLRYAIADDTAAPRIPPIELGDSTYPRTYWLEGALVGGTFAAILVGSFAGSMCTHDDSSANGPCWDNVLLGGAVGFASGGSLGALIGGQFKKPAKLPETADEATEPVPQDSIDSAP